jgi:peptidoglycan hydrolase-like protein with peptidoglycan-binding domain
VLQRRLAGSGFAPGPIDGRYGPLTERAVRRFQAAHGLQVDGIAGRRTLAARSTPSEVLFPTSGYDSRGGSAPVRALQRRLARAGDPPGPIDGRYGPLTERAVIRFQAANGLQVDGIAGPRTLARVSLKGGSRRQLHHRSRPRHSRPTATHRGSRPRHSRPTVAHHRPTAAPAPATAHHAGHSVGSSSTLWLMLVAGALLALLASVSRYARRRRSASPGTEDLNDGMVAVSSMDLGAEELLGPVRAFRRADHRGDAHGAFSLGVALEQRGDLAGAAAA